MIWQQHCPVWEKPESENVLLYKYTSVRLICTSLPPGRANCPRSTQHRPELPLFRPPLLLRFDLLPLALHLHLCSHVALALDRLDARGLFADTRGRRRALARGPTQRHRVLRPERRRRADLRSGDLGRGHRRSGGPGNVVKVGLEETRAGRRCPKRRSCRRRTHDGTGDAQPARRARLP